jgi:UDP-N-acetylglucosamine diphosphorylase / glucose-1-phosphate thymidylyltransferase / UDP-N-acetylgalactosamine diphosphorylase / glucosamine-1-phosphate N-acetyltransferase / galactosamine-1-phosphate N-acetyltransferase
MNLGDYVRRVVTLRNLRDVEPWTATEHASSIVETLAEQLVADDSWDCSRNGIAVHLSASVSPSAIVDSPAVIGPDVHISHGAYLRGGVWLDAGVVVGPHCEIKSSFVFAGSRVAHLNYVGNSIIGEDVNIEAGAVIANHWNERDDKAIFVRVDDETIATGVSKFGAVVGDGCRIGANAVTSPGTILLPGTVVGRLQLVDQSLAV